MFKGATPAHIFNYCQDMSQRHPSGEPTARSPGSQAFFQALIASDAICAMVRDWPTESIIRTCPFITCALWAPACIQLLVKSFAGCAKEIAEKASLSLRILTIAMEKFAEYWGLGRLILGT